MLFLIDMFNFADLWDFIAQAAVPESQNPSAVKQATEGDSGSGGFQSFFLFLPMMLAVMIVFMLLSGRPQKKEQAKRKGMLENLKKNDRILTAGGIVGTVVNVGSDNEFVTVRIDESNNTRLKILRSSIARVLTDEDKKGSIEAEK